MNNNSLKKIYKIVSPKNRAALSLVSKNTKRLVNEVKHDLAKDIVKKWSLRSKDMKKLLNYILEKRLNGDVLFTTNEARVFKYMNITEDTAIFNDFKIPSELKYNGPQNLTGNYPQFILLTKNNKDYVFTKSQLTIHKNNGNVDIIPYSNAVSFKDLLKRILSLHYKFKLKLFNI